MTVNRTGPETSDAVDGQLTAPNRLLDVDAARFVFRRFGDTGTARPPLLCLQHFRGNLDSWDPALVDRIAAGSEVILLGNRGVGGSTGAVPENVSEMARDALRFVDALGLKRLDVLGFSLGGYVAQEVALLRPRVVRRIVLAGTAPRGGPDLHRWTDEVYELATQDETSAERFLKLFFSGSAESQRKGREYLGRAYARTRDRDAPTDLACRDAQLAAITAWGIPEPSKLDRLAGITQPTFVAAGDNDAMMHTANSRLLARRLPDARLRIYPDANHGFLDQYPERFADHVNAFLDERS
jgi:pimeloyl-ACP methyl ester carboxylesterase